MILVANYYEIDTDPRPGPSHFRESFATLAGHHFPRIKFALPVCGLTRIPTERVVESRILLAMHAVGTLKAPHI